MKIGVARKIERNGINGRKGSELSRINPCAIYSEDMQASIEEASIETPSIQESIQELGRE
jgi:hypothetical protein